LNEECYKRSDKIDDDAEELEISEVPKPFEQTCEVSGKGIRHITFII